ncbi:glycosyltransferase family 2 protein [Sporolactobacillus sp. THM19-2]|uniref:glycosyltransferase family 2 protein n=1 Tax=Sporolactobacillus sp. THM19-2 TaxID=2511171 RepID=UPI00102045CF|nr:glycosyltransferase family 2 protein [Sporolactobacillus sp. THM19-2]RYL93936.1 glycosyltransferase family 2 protein [Sporolactobacillus sp. THM19-2]
MNNPDIAIILVNWNGYRDTIECLKSLNNLTYNHFQVFIVDNGSTDNSYALIYEHITHNFQYKFEIQLIQNKENMGFAGGNNIAIKRACKLGFQYIWLLNNDTIVDSSSLSTLVSCITKNRNVGIVGSKIFYYNTNKIWFAGGLVNLKTGKVKHIGIKKFNNESYNHIREVDYITGCSMLFRSEIIRSIGYISEDYFLYYEETDFNVKAHKAGWKIIFVPNSIIYHKVSVSSGGENNLSPYYAYYDIRNAFWLCKRNNAGLPVLAFLYMIYKSIKKMIQIVIKNQKNKKERIYLILNGIRDALLK